MLKPAKLSLEKQLGLFGKVCILINKTQQSESLRIRSYHYFMTCQTQLFTQTLFCHASIFYSHCVSNLRYDFPFVLLSLVQDYHCRCFFWPLWTQSSPTDTHLNNFLMLLFLAPLAPSFPSLWAPPLLASLSRLSTTLRPTLTIQWLFRCLLPVLSRWSSLIKVFGGKLIKPSHSEKTLTATTACKDLIWLIYYLS